jgi:hypothetical protein
MGGIPSEHAKDVREALRSVAADPDLGPSTLSDAQAMSNLLKDLLPDAPREKNLLVAAAEARLAAMMIEHVGQGIDARSAIRLAAASFGANTHFTTEACDWVATELAVALDLADELAAARSQLPPGDITTARPTAVEQTAVQPGAAVGISEPHRPGGQATARPARPATVEEAGVPLVTTEAAREPEAMTRGARILLGRAGVGVLVALAGIVLLLLSFVIPLYTDPYNAAHPIRIWGGPLAWWVISGPTVSIAVAVLASALIIGRVSAVRAAASSAALLATGLQLIFVFQSVWHQASANGDRVNAGLPLGVTGAVLLIVGAAAVLLRAGLSGRAVSLISRAPR